MWLSVPNVERKSALPRSLGRWLEDQTRAARKRNSRSGSSSIAEKLSEQLQAKERSDLGTTTPYSFFHFVLARARSREHDLLGSFHHVIQSCWFPRVFLNASFWAYFSARFWLIFGFRAAETYIRFLDLFQNFFWMRYTQIPQCRLTMVNRPHFP